MPQTDFTKAFPHIWYSNVQPFGSGTFWRGGWDGHDGPLWNPPCVRDYMQSAYNDQIEADGWETVYASRGKCYVMGIDWAEGKGFRSSAETFFSDAVVSGLTKDPTDWEPDLADQEFEEGLRKKKRALNTNWEPER